MRQKLQLENYMTNCTLCPRKCRVNRFDGQVGYCKTGAEIVAARAALHFWEEPCISGTNGSGTVFFSGCNMRCVFCQNHSIAAAISGQEISLERLSDIFLELQEKGAHNINLVTPTHYIPQIVIALQKAKENGLSIPIVYNTGGYEEVSSLKLLDGLIDIYLPDFKYKSTELSMNYSGAADYFAKACDALAEMYRQVGDPAFAADGLMKRGIIVRHLLLPGQTADTKRVLRYLHETYHDHIYISIMNQYTPLPHVEQIPDLNRKVTDEEYRRVLSFAEEIGIEKGFRQEGETAAASFIPAFNGEGL